MIGKVFYSYNSSLIVGNLVATVHTKHISNKNKIKDVDLIVFRIRSRRGHAIRANGKGYLNYLA